MFVAGKHCNWPGIKLFVHGKVNRGTMRRHSVKTPGHLLIFKLLRRVSEVDPIILVCISIFYSNHFRKHSLSLWQIFFNFCRKRQKENMQDVEKEKQDSLHTGLYPCSRADSRWTSSVCNLRLPGPGKVSGDKSLIRWMQKLVWAVDHQGVMKVATSVGLFFRRWTGKKPRRCSSWIIFLDSASAFRKFPAAVRQSSLIQKPKHP